jgi:hypothetical protein
MSISKIDIEDIGLALNDKVIVEYLNRGSDDVWNVRTGKKDRAIVRAVQRAIEDRLSKVLTNGIIWDRTNSSGFESPFSFSVTGSDDIITLSTNGRIIINGRQLLISAGDIDLGSLTVPPAGADNYWLFVKLNDLSTGDTFEFTVELQSTFDADIPSHRDKRVRIASFAWNGTQVTSVTPFSGEITAMGGAIVPNHDHSGDFGDGEKPAFPPIGTYTLVIPGIAAWGEASGSSINDAIGFDTVAGRTAQKWDNRTGGSKTARFIVPINVPLFNGAIMTITRVDAYVSSINDIGLVSVILNRDADITESTPAANVGSNTGAVSASYVTITLTPLAQTFGAGVVFTIDVSATLDSGEEMTLHAVKITFSVA